MSTPLPPGVDGLSSQLLDGFYYYIRKCIFGVLSVGPIPNHISFIMDGNRRYAKKMNLAKGEGHAAGFSALSSFLRYCYELGVKYVSVYAFSIDNFKRKPEEVQSLMELMKQKIEEMLEHESIVNEYGVRLHFIGNLQLLSEPVRAACEKAMRVTAKNNQRVLAICVAYTSKDEIVHSVQESCKEKWVHLEESNVAKAFNNDAIASIVKGLKTDGIDSHFPDTGNDGKGIGDYIEAEITPFKRMIEITDEMSKKGKEGDGEAHAIKLVDIERNMYMAIAPDPDILIRTSGEARLSNFLLWQTSTCPLYAPKALWPEIGAMDLILAVLNYQKYHGYLEKKKKQA